jgi:peptidoglycan hydrolase-like protein with peptidoglycan-binding domain
MCGASIQCPVFNKYQKVGDQGGEVPQIQRFLKDLGYYNGTDNGIFDPALKNSVSQFQKEFSPMVLEP